MGLEIARNRGIVVRCAHDGYQRLPGNPAHVRRWSFGESALVVEDRVLGKFGHAEARFHLHPSIELDDEFMASGRGEKVVLKLPQGQEIRFSVEGGVLRKEAAIWHSEFGYGEPNLCLVVDFSREVLRTHLEWGGTA